MIVMVRRAAIRQRILVSLCDEMASDLVLLTLLAFVLEAWQRGGAGHQERVDAIRGEWRR